jgi:hypothetical protein
MDEQNTDAALDGMDKSRNVTWENNHRLITEAIRELAIRKERLATAADIARETGLSTVTVNKHLNEFGDGKHMTDQMRRFGIMADQILGTVLYKCIMGDVRSLRLSAQLIGFGKPPRKKKVTRKRKK